MGLLTLLLAFVFFAGIAMTVNEGLWSNTITVFIILIAALIAIPWGYIAGVAIIDAVQPSAENAWAFTFAAVWGVFALSAIIMRTIADQSSRVRVRFIPQLDKIGGILIGLVVATMYTSFVAATLWYWPISAGVWKIAEASDFQKTAMMRATAPIHTAVTKFHGREMADIVQHKN